MAIAAELSQFIIMAICLFVSPIDNTMGVYMDAVEHSAFGELDSLYVMHDSAGPQLHVYADGTPEALFTVEKKGEATYVFSAADSKETIKVNLQEYLSPEDLKKLHSEEEESISINLLKGLGELVVKRKGMVTYLMFQEFSRIYFAVHE